MVSVGKSYYGGLMKTTLLVIALLFSSASFASSAQIITSTVKGEVTIGFSDSSFDYAVDATSFEKNFCFTGNITKVCAQIKKDASKMNIRYGQGAHDRIDIQSCEVTQDMDDDGYHPDFGSERIITTYELSDDYGSEIKLTREIRQCSRI